MRLFGRKPSGEIGAMTLAEYTSIVPPPVSSLREMLARLKQHHDEADHYGRMIDCHSCWLMVAP